MLKLTATEEEGGAGKILREKKEEMRACLVSQDTGCKARNAQEFSLGRGLLGFVV
jgi:hypothetical protein